MTTMNTATGVGQPEARELRINLRDHNIGFYLPAGGRLEGRLALACGALIGGDFVGDIVCSAGSIVIQAGARIRGRLEAERIYVEGEVSSAPGQRSILVGRTLLAAGARAAIDAEMYATTWELRRAKLWGAVRTLEELPATAMGGRDPAPVAVARAEPRPELGHKTEPAKVTHRSVQTQPAHAVQAAQAAARNQVTTHRHEDEQEPAPRPGFFRRLFGAQ